MALTNKKRKGYLRTYYKQNKDKALDKQKKNASARKEVQKAFYVRNSAKLQRAKKERYNAEPEKIRQAQRDSYHAEPEKKKQAQRDSYRKLYILYKRKSHSRTGFAGRTAVTAARPAGCRGNASAQRKIVRMRKPKAETASLCRC